MSDLPSAKRQQIFDLIRVYGLGLEYAELEGLLREADSQVYGGQVDVSLLPHVDDLRGVPHEAFQVHRIWLYDRGNDPLKWRPYRRLRILVRGAMMGVERLTAVQLGVVFPLLHARLMLGDRKAFPKYDAFRAMVNAVLRVLEIDLVANYKSEEQYPDPELIGQDFEVI